MNPRKLIFSMQPKNNLTRRNMKKKITWPPPPLRIIQIIYYSNIYTQTPPAAQNIIVLLTLFRLLKEFLYLQILWSEKDSRSKVLAIQKKNAGVSNMDTLESAIDRGKKPSCFKTIKEV